MLGALGYTVSRTFVKNAAVAMLAVVVLATGAGGMLTACSSAQRTAVEHALWDCTAPERAELVAAVTPLADSAIQKATNPDGTIDTTKLKATFSKANLESDGGSLLTCAVANAFAALMTTSQAGQAVSALSAPLTGEETGVDVLPDPNLLRQELPNPLPKPAALRQAFDELRAAQFPGATFKTLHGEI